MGRKMIKCQASDSLSPSADQTITSDEDNSYELLEAEANLDYLCNMAPHRYEAVCGKMLSHSMLGEAFVSKYIDHGDPVTAIDPKRSYDVKAATRHPIYENFRVKALLTSSISDDQLISLRELMYQIQGREVATQGLNERKKQ